MTCRVCSSTWSCGGIERRDIFLDDSDRTLFVDRFSSLLVETGMECLAWSLLTNHFHHLLRCRQVELSRFMRRLLTGYAVNFNRRHGRSGHAVVLGHEQLPGQMVDELLLRFGRRLSTARKKYLEFVAAGEGQGRRPELVGGGLRRSRQASGQEECAFFDDRILGSGAFVETLRRDRDIRRLLPPKVSLVELQETVSALFAIKSEDILRRARKNAFSEARAVFCSLAIRKLGKSGAEIGRHLGMASSAVSRAVRRGELILAGKSSLSQKLEESLEFGLLMH